MDREGEILPISNFADFNNIFKPSKFFLILTVWYLKPLIWTGAVTPTFGSECSQDRLCVMESSCPYWLERKASWRKGQDNNYRSDRRNQVCNTQLRALCCPKPGKWSMIILQSLISNKFKSPNDTHEDCISVQGVTRRPILTESPGNTGENLSSLDCGLMIVEN